MKSLHAEWSKHLGGLRRWARRRLQFSRKILRKRFRLLCQTFFLRTLLLAISVFVCGSGFADEAPKYSYYHQDELIVLKPSPRLIVLPSDEITMSEFLGDRRIHRDRLSDSSALRERGIAVYRIPVSKGQTPEPAMSPALIEIFIHNTGKVSQPVFEQGASVLIPADEVIVGLDGIASLDQAVAFLGPNMDNLGIVAMRAHRPNTFIVTIQPAGNGRAFDIARALSARKEVTFAEPNFIVISRNGLYSPAPAARTIPTARPVPEVAALPAETWRETEAPFTTVTTSGAGAVEWVTIASLDFESPDLPYGWSSVYYLGATPAHWGRTSYRARSGSHSLYCAAGGFFGTPAPGPAPASMHAYLMSPFFNFQAYQEVYLEFWFYAKNEQYPDSNPEQFFDYAEIEIIDYDTGRTDSRMLVSGAGGDMTLDPTTENGWRRALIRVGPGLRKNVVFFFNFITDWSVQTEGVYLDDIRIIGTTNVDAFPVSNDTYSARQYELRNSGQIAGLGNRTNDMKVPEAWDLVSVSPDIVVAVIDSGVDLGHPDLNLVTGYNADGTVGGGPDANYPDAHGTACAGNVGAIGNNNAGVVGVAPGVKIMPINNGGETATMATALDVAVLRGAKILSNSWGWVGAPSTDITNAVNDALSAGRIVVFAAGNGPDRAPWTYEVAFPGSLTGSSDVISVGASSPTDEHKSASSSDGEFAWGSSYIGAGPDIVAPGPWSYTTDIRGAAGYNDGSKLADPAYNPAFGGTSSSAPKVSGIVALMLSGNPHLTPGQVKSILASTADDIDAPGLDDKTGAGRVNAFKAVLAAQGGSVPEAPAAPTNLTAAATATDRIDLAWTDNATNEDGFRIQIRTGLAGDWTTDPGVWPADTTGASIQNLDSSTPYFFRVYAFNSAGNSGFSNEASATTPPDETGPSNDRFAGATIIHGLSGAVSATNTGASREPGEPDHANVPGGGSVWFRWTSPSQGVASFDTFGSDFDTVLAVYTGDNVAALTWIASNDDADLSLQSKVEFQAVRDTVYHIAVDGYRGASGQIALNWALVVTSEPPVITSPLTAAGNVGVPFRYEIIATNDPLFHGCAGLPEGLTVDETTGVISGIPRKMGIFDVALTASNESGECAETLKVTIAARPFDLWRVEHFGPDAGDPEKGGAYGDYNGDGVVNLMKYALGHDPATRTPFEPPHLEKGAIVLTYTRRREPTDVEYTVKVSEDLHYWHDPGAALVEKVLEDGEIQKIEAGIATDHRRLFLRLEVRLR